MKFRTNLFPGALHVLGLICLLVITMSAARAASTRDPGFLARAKEVEILDDKEFAVNVTKGHRWKQMDAFTVMRAVEDPLRKGWTTLVPVGRAAISDVHGDRAKLVVFRFFGGEKLKPGDRIVSSGAPLTDAELGLLRNEVLGVLNRDKEIEDFYRGIISLKAGYYAGSLSSTSDSDTNSAKQAAQITMMSFGLRWWTSFNPKVGINLEFARGSIPTKSFLRTDETSSQTYINPGLMYRARFFMFPTIYTLTYAINSFSTSNTDDFLISSTYSGPTFGVTFNLPWSFSLLRIGRFVISLSHLELGGGVSPMVMVSDDKFVRGTGASGSMLSANAAAEFNFNIPWFEFTKDLFIAFEAGLQSYSLNFDGPTQGLLPNGSLIPEGGKHSEFQYWGGVRLKYNIPDFIGAALNDM